MTYQHFEPPVASVTLDAYEYPIELSRQMLISAWNGHSTGVMVYLSALCIYRDVTYGPDKDWPGYAASTEAVINFAHRHPYNPSNTYTERGKQLCVQLLDHIKFFEGLEECVGISDDKPSTDV